MVRTKVDTTLATPPCRGLEGGAVQSAVDTLTLVVLAVRQRLEAIKQRVSNSALGPLGRRLAPRNESSRSTPRRLKLKRQRHCRPPTSSVGRTTVRMCGSWHFLIRNQLCELFLGGEGLGYVTRGTPSILS